MYSETRSADCQQKTASETRAPGQVLCFVSAKGGTGKTILSATATYSLLKAGMRVVAIDADFSTRGLSLYLLGEILKSKVAIRSENCLADAILDHVPVEAVEPLTVVRDSLDYNVIISNKEVWRGGVPDERFLGIPGDRWSTDPLGYHDYLTRLCDHLRCQFDYVIIDTRGGFDFTSAGPACVADGYVVVLEADKISIEQVRGFKQKIDEFAESLSNTPGNRQGGSLKGFIVNKAVFSVDDKVFPEELARLYDSETFGVIPADPNAIRAYQTKDIPLERFPDSDFAYYGLRALEKLIAPSINWRSAEATEKFSLFAGRVRGLWNARQRVHWLQTLIPVLLIVLVVVSVSFYLLFKGGGGSFSLPAFYGTTSILVLASILGAMLGSLGVLRKAGVGRRARQGVGLAFAALFVGLVYLTSSDIPRTFSRDALLVRIQSQDRAITEYSQTVDELEKNTYDLQTQLGFIIMDKSRAEAALDEARRQLSSAQTTAGEAQQGKRQADAQLAEAQQAKKQLDARLADAQQQISRLQAQVEKLQSPESYEGRSRAYRLGLEVNGSVATLRKQLDMARGSSAECSRYVTLAQSQLKTLERNTESLVSLLGKNAQAQ